MSAHRLQFFNAIGLRIAFVDEGDGTPIVLLHGFASNARVNWVGTGWVAHLVRAGFRVIAMDNRGHGESEKPHDTAAYPAPVMARDVVQLMDHLALPQAHVMGYSMGARIAAFLCLNNPERVTKAVFAGLGINMVRGTGDPAPVIAALEAAHLDDVHDPKGRMFRKFAEQTGSDLKALAACMKAPRHPIDAKALAKLTMPILVAVGSKDTIAGSADALAALIPSARALDIPGRDHMRAVGDPAYKAGVVAFLRTP